MNDSLVEMKYIIFPVAIILFLSSCRLSQPDTSGPDPDLNSNEEQLSSFQQILKVETITMGSCNRSDVDQILWDDILNTNPDLWIWLGDNIYGDSEDLSILEQKYNRQNANEGYQQLRKSVPIMGIWDDHDYGANNSGKYFSAKQGSRDLLFEFLEVPKADTAWQREGAYQTYLIQTDTYEIRFILLDSRYFRDNPIRDPNSNQYLPNRTGTILGKIQWNWLEGILADSEADIHIIANGIQVIPEEHSYEKWSNFPLERFKLFDLLTEHEVSRPILLSGDRHLSEISRIHWRDRPIYEITSSGLTHSYEEVGNEPNKYRVSELISQKSFATLQFDWSDPKAPKITSRLLGNNGQVFDEISLKF